MKQFYNIGTVLRFEGKNYEVVEGSGDNEYNACGRCAMYGGVPGSCQLSKYDDLSGSCSAVSRPDRKSVHYRLTNKIPFAFYGGEPEEEPEYYPVKPSEEEKKELKAVSDVMENFTERVEDEYVIGDGAYVKTIEEAHEEDNQTMNEVAEAPTYYQEEENKQENINMENMNGTPQLSVVRAKNLEGKNIEGVLITTEDGSKYIMPYGAKVLMDGSCNLVKFDESTLSYMTRYRDMNGRQIYTGDELKVVTLGGFNNKYNIHTVDVQKRGVVPLFYTHGTNEHSDDVALSGNDVINGYVIDCGGESENVSDWFASVMNTVSKTIGNGSEIGTEEYKTLYKMYLVDNYLKNN